MIYQKLPGFGTVIGGSASVAVSGFIVKLFGAFQLIVKGVDTGGGTGRINESDTDEEGDFDFDEQMRSKILEAVRWALTNPYELP